MPRFAEDGSNRTMFDRFKDISPYEPMAETDFYKWLDSNEDIWGETQRFNILKNALIGYFGQFGFRMEDHFLPFEQVKLHKHVFEFFWFRELRGLNEA